MKKALLFTALCAITLNANANPDLKPDLEKGERTFRLMCISCHGKQGEKAAFGQSAIINKLKAEQIVTALQARKKGEIIGAGNGVKGRLSEEDMQNVAAFLESLDKNKP